ncbi:MAG TPA: FAD-binding oxidoreductase [Candidatus Limnocylindrales bacterium]
MSIVVSPDVLQPLRDTLRGVVLAPEDEGYDEARRVFNGMIDRRPALIARCRGTADIQAVVRWARERDLPIAVRAGGHNVSGRAICDDGVVVDLSLMRSARVDVAARTVRADPGCTWVDFDTETTAHGLATTGGTVGSTGIAGLTLGGGVGWLMGSYGLTCDNVVSFDLVTADAEALTVSPESHPDLFWGLRGGGGNFGVVSSFEYRLHPVETLLAGLVLYPIDHAREALELFRETASSAPDPLTVAFVMVTVPDGVGPVAGIAACWNGPLNEGEPLVAPLRRLGPPIDDGIRAMRYPEVQRIFAEIPFGLHNYWKGHFINDMPDDAVEAAVDSFARVTSDHSAILIEAPHGAVRRVPDEATAFGQRQARFNASALAIWEGPADPEPHIRWARGYADAIAPYASGGYVNYLGDDASADDVAAAYGRARFERLVKLKNQYDPTNVFRFNQNIVPTR